MEVGSVEGGLIAQQSDVRGIHSSQGLFPLSEISGESLLIKIVGPTLTPLENPRCGCFMLLDH